VTLHAVGAAGYGVDGAPRALLVLAHGAGAGQAHPFMAAVARGLSARGIAVVTFDFPYMRAGRRVPDKAPVLEASFREAIDAAREWSPGGPLFIGGKSMGGRMATHLAAQGLDGLAGVVALGYPLHPLGRPTERRIAHLPSIVVPVLVVQGERDAFGTPEELRPAIGTMSAAVTLHVVAGADHSLSVRGRTREQTLDPVLDAVAAWMTAPLR
jgi:predicted alpha/beta-hydrolase family hydrolase